MACMEHYCLDCDQLILNNEPSAYCPECGEKMFPTFDEQWDHFDDDEPEDTWARTGDERW